METDVENNSKLQKLLQLILQKLIRVFLVFAVMGVVTTMAITRPTVKSSFVIEIYEQLNDLKREILLNLQDEIVAEVDLLPDRDTFLAEILDISEELGIDASLMLIKFHIESKLNTKAKNKDTGASGIFQLMNSTLADMKKAGKVDQSMTLVKFRKLSATEQLKLYRLYIAPYAKYIKNIEDVYVANIWPAALQQRGDAVLFRKGSIYYDQNSGLDFNNDGKVTKSDIRAICITYIKDETKLKN